MSQSPTEHFEGWKVVYVANGEPEAYIVAGRLENRGIQSWVHQEAVGSVYGFNVGPLGEVTVSVLPEDFEKALEILEEDVDDIDTDESADEEMLLDDEYADADE